MHSSRSKPVPDELDVCAHVCAGATEKERQWQREQSSLSACDWISKVHIGTSVYIDIPADGVNPARVW
jgi:hypothetical protein